MKNLAIAAIFCFVAVYSLTGVEAQSSGSLMCYNCTFVSVLGFDAGDAGCKDPFSASGISKISCDGSCVKRVLTGDIPTTMRTCHTSLEGDCTNLNGYEISPGNTISQACCSGNLCNGAGAVTINLFAALVALCMAAIFKF